MYIHSEDDYRCLTEDVDQKCKICHIIKNPKQIVDDCTKGIMTNERKLIEYDCPYVDSPEITDQTIRISERQWAYAIHEHAKIESECNDTKEIVDIPQQGVIELPDVSACKFKMVNGPFKNFKPYLPNYNLTVIQVKNRQAKYVTLLETIKDHFKTHTYVYFIVILTILGMFIILSMTLLICLIIKKKNRTSIRRSPRNIRTRRTNRRRNTEELREVSRPILSLPPPPRPFWAVQQVTSL
jgi:hypothetical protein